MQQNARSNFDKGPASKRSVFFIATSFCFLLLLISNGSYAQKADTASGRNWRVHHLPDTVMLVNLESTAKEQKKAAAATPTSAKDSINTADSLYVANLLAAAAPVKQGQPSTKLPKDSAQSLTDSSRLPVDSTQAVVAAPAKRLLADTTVLPTPDTTVHIEPDSTLQEALKPKFWQLPGSKEHTPKGATIRSLLVPGWGQFYNKEYWKIPLAVAAVGIPVYLYIDNSREYNSARTAYSVVFEEMPVVSGGKGKLDPEKFAKLDPKFQEAYNRYKEVGGNYVTNFLSTVQNYRNTFRQYRDYSIVAALLGWGLQIADATVFGHLHGFDVSDDISLKVKPVYFQYARIPGIGLSLSF